MMLVALSLVIVLVCMNIHHGHGHGYGRSDIPTGYQVSVGIPEQYSNGYVGRAFVLETTTQLSPNFKAALSVEAINGKYACSVDVFLGEVKVWNSGHSSPFYTSEKCVLELTDGGDLRLMGPNELLGWRTGTNGQGVKRIQLLRTGNLVLMDMWNHIKWQSFNFPTDVMLWGQRLNVATRLTSFIGNSTSFYYSFEIQQDKIALYLNSYKHKYSYWEFKPSVSRNITFIQLHSRGLELFNDRARRIAQVSSHRLIDDEPLRFLLLGNPTGNLGLYYYSPNKSKFEASFQALNSTCDLPLACKQYGVCTFTNACSCIQLLRTRNWINSDCDGESPAASGRFCSRAQIEMLQLEGVDSVLRSETSDANVSKEHCANLCMSDCDCVAALHSANLRKCFLYELLGGVKQVEKGSGLNFFIKVPKGTNDYHGTTSNLRKWVLALIGVFDGVILFLLLGCLGCYAVRRRRNNLLTATENAT